MDKIFDLYDLQAISKLADIVNEKELSEITLIDGGKEIIIKGKKCPPPAPMPMTIPSYAPQSAPITGEAPVAAAPVQAKGNIVKAPIIGTFYSAAAPDKPAFATVGQKVKKGDVLLIIESMKLMNEVKSEFDGTVAEILVNNGDAVEFDQPLMRIE